MTAWDIAGILAGVFATMSIVAMGLFIYWGYREYLDGKRSETSVDDEYLDEVKEYLRKEYLSVGEEGITDKIEGEN